MNGWQFPNLQTEKVFRILQEAWRDKCEITPETPIHAFNTGLFVAGYVDALDMAEMINVLERLLPKSQSDQAVHIKDSDKTVGEFAATLAAHLQTDERIDAFHQNVRASHGEGRQWPLTYQPVAGDEVYALWNGYWWPAKILAVNAGNNVRVHYLGWSDSWDEDLTPDRYRADRAGLPPERVIVTPPTAAATPVSLNTPAAVFSPTGLRWFITKLAQHVVLTILGILGLILFEGVLGGMAASFGWLSDITSRKSDSDWPDWVRYTFFVVVCLGAAGGLITFSLGFLKMLREKLALWSRWIRVPAYIIGVLIGVVVGAALGAVGAACVCGMFAMIYAILILMPLSAGFGIGQRYFGWSGETFFEGFGIGVVGAMAPLLLFGVPIAIIAMIGDLWKWIKEWMQQYATGRALVRSLYGAIAGSGLGALAGWFSYEYAWSNGWVADAGGSWALAGVIVGALLSGLAQMPREAPEQFILNCGGAILGCLVFFLGHWFSVGGSFWSYVGTAFLGALVGVLITWGCWLIFAITAGWFVKPGPIFNELHEVTKALVEVEKEIEKARNASVPIAADLIIRNQALRTRWRSLLANLVFSCPREILTLLSPIVPALIIGSS